MHSANIVILWRMLKYYQREIKKKKKKAEACSNSEDTSLFNC